MTQMQKARGATTNIEIALIGKTDTFHLAFFFFKEHQKIHLDKSDNLGFDYQPL